METGQPSRTALAVALARAEHQALDDPRIFTDPFASRIVGDSAAAGEFDGVDPEVARVRRLVIAARSRFADDRVAAAIARGTRQVVILGAGLDTSAYRNQHPDVRYFEVDHPDTQSWKRNRLRAAGIEPPPTLTFAPVDFERSTLAAGLAAAGLDRTAGAIFVWLGVVVYLTRGSIDETLGFIAGQRADLVFDYPAPPAPESAAEQRARADRVAAAGEPWLSYFTADEVHTLVEGFGFAGIEDRTAGDLLREYGSHTTHPIGSGIRLVHATTR
ncbi:class I SAM-dependent methyltransferase [Nocardia asteroides]|uniref:class I SAM-dependent methyltransferase n=1 Tax=Nocardia asteroides TaxID=1824 RepID=UPI001E5861F6|nr:class I SAM-dependent methyltransferase [Nocardia asteroides]UGT62309.1 class I SAM-dependent methyltransferase [Nocardia asteroides]